MKAFGWLVAITIVVTFAAFPAGVPQEVRVGGLSFEIYELLLLATAVFALAMPATVSVTKYAVPFMVLCVVAAVLSLVVAGADFGKMGSDVRWVFYTALTMYIASKVVGTPHQKVCLQAILLTIWFSAVTVVLASTTDIKLLGTSEAASLTASGGDTATRFLTPTTFLAVVVAMVCICCMVSGNPRRFNIALWLVPSAVLIVLSFSRNHLLGLGVAMLFALSAFRSARSVVATIGIASIVVLAGVLIQLGAANIFASLPATDYVAAQAHGYVERVVDGLTAKKQAIDPSVQYRLEEDARLTKAISTSELVGHGFGYAYQAPSGPPGDFLRETAPYYAHNFYLWLLLKVGWIGMAVFAWMAFVPVLKVLWKPVSTMQVAMAAAAAGLLAISVYAPIPNGSPSAPLLGAVLGAVVVLSAARPTADRDTPESGSAEEPEAVRHLVRQSR